MRESVNGAIAKLVEDVIRKKMATYASETESKPFFDAIFTKKQIRLASFIQSFYTTFGMSMYEQMAVILANGAGYHAEKQYILKGEIDKKTETLITDIHLDLQKGKRKPNALKELEEIRKSIKLGKEEKDPDSVVDVFIRKPNGDEYYFDITTVKPNKKEFTILKKKLLRWLALRASTNKKAKVNVGVVFPYNPYEPQPYLRWTSGNLYDKSQLIVGEDFWNLCAGEKVYPQLLDIFKKVGQAIRPELEHVTEQ